MKKKKGVKANSLNYDFGLCRVCVNRIKVRGVMHL
jgi:hypothetical protein